MLVPSMNPGEITKELLHDFAHLDRTTLPRLTREYERERKKLNIDKTRTYTRVYSIKTATKNNWLFFMRKKLAVEKFRGADTLAVCPVVYFHGNRGLQVFNFSNPELIGVYNAHLFTRYNERMGLNLHLMADVVKHFFYHNGQISYHIVERKKRTYIIGFTSNGFTLGGFENDKRWLVHRTFVSNDMIKPDQANDIKELFFKYQLMVAFEPFIADSGKSVINIDIIKDKLKSREDFDPR